MLRLSFILTSILAVIATSAARADEEAAGSNEPRATALVRDLGDSRFQVREGAESQLKEMGGDALPALRQAVDSPDLEIRYRSRRLIKAATRLDYQRRLNAFLKNPAAANAELLPDWTRFREIAGTSAESQTLFIAIVRAESGLFELASTEPQLLTARFEQRCFEVRSSYANAPGREALLPNIFALVFLASDPRVAASRRAERSLCGFTNYSQVNDVFADKSAKGECLRKLLGRLVGRAGGQQDSKVMLALRLDLKEGIVPALEILRNERSGARLQTAALAVGKFGNRQHVAELERLFDMEQVVIQRSGVADPTYPIQVRDVALAVAVHLSGLQPLDYGFDDLKPDPIFLFERGTTCFRSAEHRVVAFAKWTQWKASQPPAVAGEPHAP